MRIASIVLAALGAAAAAGSQQPDTSTRAIVAAAARYVAEYQRQLTSIVAEEIYTQRIVDQVPLDPRMPRVRTLRGEVFFMFAPGRGDWMAIRDVIAMDGREVADRPDVHLALRTLPARDVSATFKQYNSQFNIGRTFRNFNEPTLALLVLDDEHRDRFAFDRKQTRREADGTLVATLAFRERERPTLIRDVEHGHVFSRGELAVELETGRIRRAVLTAAIGPTRLALTTAYAPEARLEIWVPEWFREEYERRRSREYERILCQASYSSYRRFETSVRIK